MDTFLFLLLANPWCAAISIAVVVYLVWGQVQGVPFSPFDWLNSRQELARLTEMVRSNPHDAKAQAELGRMLVVRGRHAQAITHLELALQRMENVPEPHYHLGLAYLGRGDWDTGKREIDFALQLRPELHYGEPFLKIGDFLAARRDAAGAVGYYQQFTSINASSSEGFHKLGLAHLALGHREEARRAWQESLAAHAQSPAYKRVNRLWSWRSWLALRQYR